MTVEAKSIWIVPDVPVTDEPDVLRRYIDDLLSIEDKDRVVEGSIAAAERALAELERPRQTAA